MKHDLIIIGGGPAGMTAGIYAGRLGLKTLLITKSFGGQIAKKAVSIENYPGFESISGIELVQKIEKHLKSQKIDIEMDEIRKVEKKNNDFLVFAKSKKEFQVKAVILASGADPRPLEVPGEKEFIGKGVSYCSVCDGPLFKDKVVAVIGGGNAGFETAIFLGQHAKKIYILEYASEPGADAANQEIVKKAGKTEIITNAAPREIKGKDFVGSIIYEDRKTGKEKTLKVQGVFVEIGYQPATSYVRGLVDFNERDEIKVDYETCQTKTPGLFAAGDVNVGSAKQIVTAAGEGAKAAIAAYNYIQKKT
ncbi:FAD-dependent oxidoreductase [Patescibacteria group bacterium]|nr:FAD-dependent oxidoreductase [Patescibacteria group bacterium]